VDQALEQKIEVAYVLFTDIVGYSKLPLDKQVAAVAELQALISKTDQFKKARDQNVLLTMHTGDGGALAFFNGPEAPVLCALELAASLKDRPHLKMRMGIHAGPVYRAKDIQGGENAAGGGINFAQRVMDCGDAGHILLSDSFADMLMQHSKWAESIHELGVAEVKHGVKLRLFNLCTGEVGNSDLPTKLRQTASTGLADTPAAREKGDLSSLPKEIYERYDVQRVIGRGGMGIVYEATDRETGAKVALKTLKPEIADQAELVERFKSELLLARKITHRNVCRLHDMSRFHGLAVIAMEFVDGESLRTRLSRSGQLSLEQSLEIAGQMLDGLEEAHRQGVVHRDLKPENIMIARDGTVKIMDFGIAKAINADTTASGGFSGTPAYISPEQTLGQPAEIRSDIYSFGLILYEMLCGKRAFSGDSAVAIAMKQVNETPVAPRQLVPSLPGYIESAILRCIEKDRTRRFGSTAEVRTALLSPQVEAAGTQESVSVNSGSKSRLKIAVAAGIALLIAGIGGTWLFRPSGPPANIVSTSPQPGPAVPPTSAPPATPVSQSPAKGPSIAVLDFANLQKDSQYENLQVGIAESFTTSFVQSKQFRIVERTQLEKIQNELRLNQSGAVDTATAQRVGKLIGAEYLVLGSFQVFGGQVKINSRLLRVETGEIVQSGSETGAVTEALSLPDKLANRFLSEIK
jgi:serine/threonine protein kinase/class 3 adenylate cyclase